MSINEYVDSLSVSQLQFAQRAIEKRLGEHAGACKKIVWRIITYDALAENFREEDSAGALARLLEIYPEHFGIEVREMVQERSRSAEHHFQKDLPRIEAALVSEVEYKEFFPEG